MQKTTYANSHGLANPQNKSCAYDLCILCEYAMSNMKFRDITSTRIYNSTIKYQNTDNANIGTRLSRKALSKRKSQSDDEIQEGEDIDLNLNE